MGKESFKHISLMNVFLCLCVVMIHLTSAPLSQLTQGGVWHIIIFAVNKLLCFSVPAFIFLSGFKLYSGYGDKKINLKKFFLGRFKKILIPYIICVTVYFLYFFEKKWVNLNGLLEYIFLGTLAAHFYYIIIAVQFYLLFPFIKTIFNKFPKTITVISLICTVCCCEFSAFGYWDRFALTYIFYFVLGMFFSKYRYCNKRGLYFVVSVMGYVLFAIVHLTCSYMATTGDLVYRFAHILNIIYVTFSIMAMYGIYKRLSEKSRVLYKCSQALGKISYNVYLYHILVLSILRYDIFTRFNLSVKHEFLIAFVVLYSLIFIYAGLVKKVSRHHDQ